MPVHIVAESIGKRFRFEWIFRNLSAELASGDRLAVLGPNGSGKSTLLKILSGHLSPTKGRVTFTVDQKKIDADGVFKFISYAAPYIELVEELTLEEAFTFHSKLKPMQQGMDAACFLDLIELPNAGSKAIQYFSSGMRQRVKLALAICADAPILLLDEPTTNLDKNAIVWYKKLLEKLSGERLVIIATNEPGDTEGCNRTLDIRDYKNKHRR